MGNYHLQHIANPHHAAGAFHYPDGHITDDLEGPLIETKEENED